jgi:hypothetical protein
MVGWLRADGAADFTRGGGSYACPSAVIEGLDFLALVFRYGYTTVGLVIVVFMGTPGYFDSTAWRL